jgi:hypothetical protein
LLDNETLKSWFYKLLKGAFLFTIILIICFTITDHVVIIKSEEIFIYFFKLQCNKLQL